MTKDPVRLLQTAILLIFLLVSAGAIGYHFIEDMPPLDALYMTIITLTTVGFGEVKPLSPFGRVYTILLIMVGVGLGAWALSQVVEVSMSEQLRFTVRRSRMRRRIEALRDHYIICGYGRMGRQVEAEFKREGVPYIVIEANPEVVNELLAHGIPVVEGNSTEDHALIEAGVRRARGLVAVVDTDADNVLTVLSARTLNPGLFIVARAATEEAEGKLYRADADIVISPYVVGGRRIALAALRPAVCDYLNKVVYSEEDETVIEEFRVATDSWLAGKTIEAADIRKRTGAIILAVETADRELIISPTVDYVIRPGDTIIAVVRPDQMERLRKLAQAA